MRIERRAAILTERPGEAPRLQADLSPDAVAEALEHLASVHDVTMTISPDWSDERLLVAIDGSHAVLGLECSDGLFQFVGAEPRPPGETLPFTIGRQQADIESRYVLDVRAAANVVREWLDGEESSSHGIWERR